MFIRGLVQNIAIVAQIDKTHACLAVGVKDCDCNMSSFVVMPCWFDEMKLWLLTMLSSLEWDNKGWMEALFERMKDGWIDGWFVASVLCLLRSPV